MKTATTTNLYHFVTVYLMDDDIAVDKMCTSPLVNHRLEEVLGMKSAGGLPRWRQRGRQCQCWLMKQQTPGQVLVK
ncbi:hypothetical protein J6590_025886 [Homalodisca vitripennis]|nr:hypothetical protein J6590_025886 [Homalodisca vitripennis]